MSIGRKSVWMRGLCAGLLLGGLVACQPIVNNYGYVPTDLQLQEIEVGKDTRETVADKVGAPPLDDFRREDVWYFVASRRETYGPKAPVETDRQVVAIRFTEGGTVSNIERFGLERGEVVTLSRRVTDGAVPDIGFLRGLLSSTSLRPDIAPSEEL